jgi:hypothetical protein
MTQRIYRAPSETGKMVTIYDEVDAATLLTVDW